MTTKLIPNGKQSFYDANGAPLANGTVTFYEPGTTTFKDTWQDQEKSTLNTNPIDLDAAGRCVAWGLGLYRQIVKDSDGNTIWDHVTNSLDDDIGNSVLWGGVSTGTANAQILTVDTLPDDTEGYLIHWIAGYTNTDEMTITVTDGSNTTGALALLKGTENGPSEMEGGEIVEGNLYVMALDTSLNAFQVVSHIPKTVDSSSITVQKLIFNPSLTTTQLTANTNNWNPTGLNDYTRVKISSSKDIDLTGITAPTATGHLLALENWGAFDITLKAADALSTAQNRFDFATDVILGADENIFMIYDGGWRLYELQAQLRGLITDGDAGDGDLAVVGAPHVIIEHLVAESTNAGDTLSSVFTKRPLNTLTRNVDTLASLSSNEFTLPAGTYYIRWNGDYYMGSDGAFTTRIYNETDGATALEGFKPTRNLSPDTSLEVYRKGDGAGVVTIAGSKAFSLQYFMTHGFTNGLGTGTGDLGGNSIYARVEIWSVT